MKKEFSLFLDLTRFLAAAVIFITHSSHLGVTGGMLSIVSSYGQSAVMVFFVLSGYVIAYVADKREKTLADYSYARLSRLYSVIFPVLCLTFLINILGNQYISNLYQGHWFGAEGVELSRYVLTFFLLHNIWDLGFYPGNNAPFWSLTFEAFYYVVFALMFYLKSMPKKLVLIILIALFAGPSIVSLFPVWLAGYWVYRFHSRGWMSVTAPWALLMVSLGLVALALSPFIRAYLSIDFPGVARDSILGDYVDGFAFGLVVLVVPVLLPFVKNILFKLDKAIVFLASLTFTLYLIHQPLVRLVAGVSPFIADPASWQNRVFVISVTLFFILLIALPCERFKHPLNKGLRRLAAKVRVAVSPYRA